MEEVTMEDPSYFRQMEYTWNERFTNGLDGMRGCHLDQDTRYGTSDDRSAADPYDNMVHEVH